MKLFLRSLCLSAAFVLGYVALLIFMFQMGAFEVLGRRTLEMMSTPIDLPILIYRSLWPVRVASLLPLIWSVGGNILIYSAPAYLYLRLRPVDRLP